jgi:hypothetical protein
MNAKLPIKFRVPSAEDSSEPNAFTQLVQKYSSAREQAVADIRAGFPVTLLQQASKFFDLPVAQIRKIAGVPSTTAQHRHADWIPAAAKDCSALTAPVQRVLGAGDTP